MSNQTSENIWTDGGTVTLALRVTITIPAANPVFTRDDVIAHAIDEIGDAIKEPLAYIGADLAYPFDVESVVPR